MPIVKPFYIFLTAIGLFVSGCDKLHVKQYEVSGMTAGSPDIIKLKAVLQSVAGQSGLIDGLSVSNSYNCFFLYRGGNVVTLEASYYRDAALVQLVGGYGTPPEFKKAKRLLVPALSAEFGSRLSMPAQLIRTP